MALQNYKGGSDAAADWAIKEEGHRLGRISGDWEDQLQAAVPNHSERNWNHGAQMTEELGLTDGNVDSQSDVDAVAKWLNENSPNQEVAPEEPKDEKIEYSEPLKRARAFVAQRDFTDMAGETTQSIFGYNPVSGSTGYKRHDGKGIAANFAEQYQTRVKDPNYEVNPAQNPDGTTKAGMTDKGPMIGPTTQTPQSQIENNDFWKWKAANNPAPVSEQAGNTLGMP